MADRTAIEWTDATFNLMDRLPGHQPCGDNCYAKTPDVIRIGKKRAGATLQGREHKAFPSPPI